MSEQMTFDMPSAAAASVLAIGLMSGTSQDGVDVALIDTDGEKISHFGAPACRPYTKDERALLRSATAAAVNLDRPRCAARRPRRRRSAGQRRACRGGRSLLGGNGLRPGDLAAIGFHGQTLLHRPERALTVQIGDGQVLAKRSAFPWSMIFAPPMSRQAGRARRWRRCFIRRWCASSAASAPVAVLNVGGVANVTFIDGEQLIACDTGPGNALLDDFLRLRTGQPLDVDGRHAAAGRVDEAMMRA